MEIIDLEHSIDNDDVTSLLDRIDGTPLRIINHVYSGLSFSYEGGAAKLEGKGSGVDVWMPLFESPSVTAVYINNLGVRHLLRLPLNVSTLYVEDIGDLERVSPWLSGKERNREHGGMTIRYTGGYTERVPGVLLVSPCITHLQLPLGEGLEDVVERNPHLESIGVDLDKRKYVHTGVSTVVWSINRNKLSHNKGGSVIESVLYG